MLQELGELLRAVEYSQPREAYRAAVIEENVLGRATTSNRRLTFQRMSELYGLDPRIPLFAVLRRLWQVDEAGRPCLALLCALARDPMLRCTAPHVLGMSPGAELVRSEFLVSIRDQVETRLNDSILDKVARNAGSSWTQTGHLNGRVRKVRREVAPTFGPVAFALWLGSLEGRIGDELLASFWMCIFDAPVHAIHGAISRAKQASLLFASIGGGVVQIDAAPVYQPITVVST